MVQNIIALALILGWIALTIFIMVRDYRKAQREGTAPACFSCAALKNGTCSHHCPTEKDVDGMIAAAKERLRQNELQRKEEERL